MKNRHQKFLKILGERLKKIRIEKGLSQYKLSYDSNVSRNQIIKIENGQLNPTICTLYALSLALEVEPKVLFDFGA